MPTAEQVLKFRADGAKFLCAVADAAKRGDRQPYVRLMLEEAQLDLTEAEADNLILTLIDEDLLRGSEMGLSDLTPHNVWLTPQGRSEVQDWVLTGQPTEHIRISRGQVNNIHFHGSVHGSNIVTSSSNFTINQINNLAEPISAIVEKLRQLLDEQNISGDDREDVEADLATLTDQTSRTDPDAGRLRASLRRVARWTGGLVTAGTAAALQSEVTELTTQVLNQLSGG